MKRRIVYSRLPQNLYDSLEELFEDVEIDNTKMEKEKEKEKESGCFTGFFVRFFQFFTKQ
jgi:hypothetical protein